MKIIYSWGSFPARKSLNEKRIEEYRARFDITTIDHNVELEGVKPRTPDGLQSLYDRNHPKLMQLYNKVASLAQSHDILIAAGETVYVPQFLNSLNIYKVFICGDDPEASDIRSKPYVHAFDHSFCLGVNFDENTKIWDKYREWGARRVDWLPLGISSIDYDPNLAEEDIYRKKRDIDAIYVGAPQLVRMSRVMGLKKKVNIELYGGGWRFFELTGRCWPLAVWLFKHARWVGKLYPFKVIRSSTYLPNDSLIPTYQRTKIGINIHLSYGPSNMRMYQLPANGVMQICDCPEGLGQVFEVGKEVVAYHSIDEAVELIKYYLEHDDERKEIAVAGFRRVIKDYKRADIFSRAIEKIKKGMVEDGIKYFKDGTPIE